MSERRPAPDGDRLPWLGPMPDRTAPGPRAAVRGLTILVVLLTLALAGTVSLLLLRERDAPGVATTTLPAPVAKADLPPALVIPPPATPPPAVPPPKPASSAPGRLAEAPPPIAKPKAPAPQVRAKSTKVVRKARAAKPRAAVRRASRPQVRVHRGAVRTWPRATRGRVVQLGAFTSAGQAVNAWRGTVRDYPYLGTLPRKIAIIRVGPKRIRYYRLQVAAPSRRHAEPICRVVRATRRACIVR